MAFSKAPRFVSPCTSGPGPGAYNLAAPSSGPAFSFACVRHKHRQRKPQQMPMAKASMPVFLGRGTGYNIMRSNAGACEKGMQEPQMQDSPLPRLDVKQLCFTAVLGQGGLAKVAKVRWQQQEFALKFLKPVQTSDQQPPDQHQRDLEGLRREAIILVECRHDLVVSAVAWISGAVEGVMLELLGPSLSYAHSNLADQLTADNLGMALYSAATALQYVHSRLISHRDVKEANLLLPNSPGSFQVKLADFDAARRLSHSAEQILDKPGTYLMWSLEARQGLHSPIADDCWALGLTFKELCDAGKPSARRELLPLLQPLLQAEHLRGNLEQVLRALASCSGADTD